MRQPMVAGNWKMHGSQHKAKTLVGAIVEGAAQVGADLVVLPPLVYISQVAGLLAGTNIAWGAQNASEQAEGAYTGEIGAQMLADLGCTYVLVGHSERRTLYNEDNELVAAKFHAASAAGLLPILCIGESLEQREAGQTLDIVKQQLDAVLALENGGKALYNAVVAYEPVWAIGTGRTASPEQAQEVHAAIRARVAEADAAVAEQLRILYGGSVKRDNAASLMAMPDIDGGLIGGASLDAAHFLDIARLCNN